MLILKLCKRELWLSEKGSKPNCKQRGICAWRIEGAERKNIKTEVYWLSTTGVLSLKAHREGIGLSEGGSLRPIFDRGGNGLSAKVALSHCKENKTTHSFRIHLSILAKRKR